MALLHCLLPVVEIIAYPWRLLGCIPLLGGLLLNLLADQAFKRNHTTVKPFDEPTHLITTGVFRLSRHPMYLGMVLILGGIALLLGTLTPFIIVPVFAALMDAIFIRAEERMLTEQFGVAWQRYHANVRRWL